MRNKLFGIVFAKESRRIGIRRYADSSSPKNPRFFGKTMRNKLFGIIYAKKSRRIGIKRYSSIFIY